MAAELKTQFIEAVRLTPDGIQDFLTTALPTAPTISTPSDVDSAIIANGVLAKFILDACAPFGGLTPVELLLRIGQHNNVLETAMLAGLEYLGEAAGGDAAVDFTIVEPEAGGAYLPGSLRLTAQVDNGSILQIAVEVGTEEPVSLASDDGVSFYGFVRLEEVGEYTATFTALFEDESTQSASVTFTMSTDPGAGNPDGSDLNALDTAMQILQDLIDQATKNAEEAAYTALGGAVVAAGRQVIRIGDTVIDWISDTASTNIEIIRDAFNLTMDELADWILGARSLSRSRTMNLDDLFMSHLAAMNSAGQTYHDAVVALYWQNNQHPAGGYTSCPEVLKDAGMVMNDKYGSGTVL